MTGVQTCALPICVHVFYTTFDVTDQVHKAPDRKHVHIIIDNADFPEPLPDEGGFDVEVDDWVEVENDIIM